MLQKNKACASYKCAETTAKRDLLILVQKCPPSLWGCSQALSRHYCSKDKPYPILFFPQTNAIKQGLSETYYSLSLRHLEPVLPQRLCYSEKWKRQTALQNKSMAFISSFCWCFWEGWKDGRKGEERKRFSALKVLFSLLFKTPVSSSQINGTVHFQIICLR